jgi:hypothetical protein
MNDIYAEQWRKMRFISRRLVLAYLIGPIGWLLIHFFLDPKDRLTPGVAIFWGACIVFLGWTAHQYKTWPCPRCGKPWQGGWFSVQGPSSLALNRRCPHCGLDLP